MKTTNITINTTDVCLEIKKYTDIGDVYPEAPDGAMIIELHVDGYLIGQGEPLEDGGMMLLMAPSEG